MKKKKSETNQLPGLGPKSQQWLNSIGVHSKKDIAKLGPFKIYRLLEKAGYPVSLNMLYGLVGALHNMHWILVKETMKEQLVKELEKTHLS